jgi:5-methylcytosine-specific restriction endonuclease McrA
MIANKDKTYCKRGHPLIERNLVPSMLRHGRRQCKQCKKDTFRRYRQKKSREAGLVANADKTHCPRGHLLAPGNLRAGNTRRCLTCHRERERKRAPHRVDALAPVLLADPCAYCGAPSEHLDHIEPIVSGGASDYTNLTGACGRCNRRKNSKPLLMFLVAKQRLGA